MRFTSIFWGWCSTGLPEVSLLRIMNGSMALRIVFFPSDVPRIYTVCNLYQGHAEYLDQSHNRETILGDGAKGMVGLSRILVSFYQPAMAVDPFPFSHSFLEAA